MCMAGKREQAMHSENGEHNINGGGGKPEEIGHVAVGFLFFEFD